MGRIGRKKRTLCAGETGVGSGAAGATGRAPFPPPSPPSLPPPQVERSAEAPLRRPAGHAAGAAAGLCARGGDARPPPSPSDRDIVGFFCGPLCGCACGPASAAHTRAARAWRQDTSRKRLAARSEVNSVPPVTVGGRSAAGREHRSVEVSFDACDRSQ